MKQGATVIYRLADGSHQVGIVHFIVPRWEDFDTAREAYVRIMAYILDGHDVDRVGLEACRVAMEQERGS